MTVRRHARAQDRRPGSLRPRELLRRVREALPGLPARVGPAGLAAAVGVPPAELRRHMGGGGRLRGQPAFSLPPLDAGGGGHHPYVPGAWERGTLEAWARGEVDGSPARAEREGTAGRPRPDYRSRRSGQPERSGRTDQPGWTCQTGQVQQSPSDPYDDATVGALAEALRLRLADEEAERVRQRAEGSPIGAGPGVARSLPRAYHAAVDDAQALRRHLESAPTLSLAQADRTLCEIALHRAGSVVEAAALLGITRHALSRRIAKHGIAWPPTAEPAADAREASYKAF